MTMQPSLPYIGPRSKGEHAMDIAAFARLEQKIDELLARLEALRGENAELDQLLKVQDGERNEVRQRIEALVQKLDSY